MTGRTRLKEISSDITQQYVNTKVACYNTSLSSKL